MSPSSGNPLASIGRALRHRNYRLFFAGQTVSLIGTWLTRVATSWLVYRLTQSSLLLGLVGFAGQIPTLFLAPVAGAWVDRWNRHRVLLVTQALAMLQSGLLAAFALSGRIKVAHVLALAAFQGIINAFDTPARQAFVVEMIDAREDLPNAIALNSSMVNAARLIGPSVAGVLIAAVGEGGCFLIDACSYLAVLGSLWAMRLKAPAQRRTLKPLGQELREGFAYVVGFAPVRSILLLLALVSLMGMPYMVLMPIIATQVLHGGASTLGFLMASTGFGALAGALYLASRRSVLGLGRVLVLGAIAFGVGLAAFSRSRSLPLSLAILFFTGLAMMVQMAASNTVLQTLVDEDKRGRVMSFYAAAFFGSAPFGSLLAGTAAQRFGAQATLLFGGVTCVLAGLWFWRQLPRLRALAAPVYVRRGILPEIATGLQSATAPRTP